MLSLEELRQILGRHDLTDEQLSAIRDTLRSFAELLIEGYLREGGISLPHRQ